MTENENPSRDDWLTVDAAFDRALDLEGEARRDFLTSLPSDLRAGVDALLEAASAPGPLDSGIHGVAGRLLEEAEAWLAAVVRDCEAGFGIDHRVTARARTLLGETYRRQGRLDEAQRELGRAVEVLRSADAPPFHVIHARLAWGAVLCDTGRAADGLESIEAAAVDSGELLEDWQTAELEIERARCLVFLSCRWDSSKVLDARETLAATRGPDDWITRRGDRLR